MIRVGIIPYDAGGTYQSQFAKALEGQGVSVTRLVQRRLLPLRSVRQAQLDVLHMDWPDSFIMGRNRLVSWLKQWSFRRRLRRLGPTKLVWTVHNLLSHDSTDEASERRLIQFLVDRCNGLIAHSGTARARLSETYALPDRAVVRVIPHGHYIDEYPNEVDRDEARGRMGLSGGGRVVLFFGNLRPYKGPDALIEAFGRVAADDDALIIAGRVYPGIDAAQLRRKAAQCSKGATVRIDQGFVPKADAQIYFNASDLVALPFRRILNSGSLLLAMSFGRCVVAPRMGSVPEVACPEAYFGYDPGDPDGLAGALREAMDCDDLARRGRAAMEFARKNYDWKDIALKARELYEAILATGPD